MRLALSAAAAMSGLVLIGIAEYGEPAMLLHAARRHWDTLVSSPQLKAPAQPEAVTQRVDQLQQEVAALKQALATRDSAAAALAPAPPAPAAMPAPSAAPAAMPAPSAAPAPAAAPTAALMVSPPAPVTPTQNHPDVSAAKAPPQATVQAPPQIMVQPPPPLRVATQAPPPLRVAIQAPPPPRVAAQAAPGVAPRQADPARVATAAPLPEPAPPAPTILVVPPSVPSPAHKARPRDVAAAQSGRAGAASPSRSRQPRPVDLARPTQTNEAMRSVLARLRQTDAPPQPAQQPAPPPPPSPSLPRLMQARAELATGRVNEAVRQLQEAQLQLVFRPIDAQGGNPAASGAAAAEVARALEALSSNNIPASQQYIAGAMRDLNGGTPTNAPTTAADQAWNGYAPAYPSR